MKMKQPIRSFVESLVSDERPLFAQGVDDHTLECSILLTLAGMGCAEATLRDGQIVWMTTKTPRRGIKTLDEFLAYCNQFKPTLRVVLNSVARRKNAQKD
jgi:hypothetical protein